VSKAKKLTEKQLTARITQEVDYWADFYGLSQTWVIRVQVAHDLEDGGATIRWEPGYKDASLKFQYSDFCEASDVKIKSFVMHELGHLLFAPLTDAIRHAIGTGTMVERLYAYEEEGVVDSISHIIRRAVAA